MKPHLSSILCVVFLCLPLSLHAEQEADTLTVDTMHVEWYQSPRRKQAAHFPTFSEATAHLPIQTDYSDASAFELDEPRFAYVNILGITRLPLNKSTQQQVWVEVHDGAGNYFKKRAIIKGQGGYSLKYPKRNFACQFCEADWSEDTTPDIRIGRWVKQDAFHFKAFYTDFSRGIGEIAYKLFDHIVSDRAPYWIRGGYYQSSKRARCYPDAFPCAVYLNGQLYGIYAWQLKKHRKNMNMEKTDENHIHLDGNLNDANLFRGKVRWTLFEVRNPKQLYTMQGKDYDGNNPQELIDTSSTYYSADPAQASAMQRSAHVKASVLRLSNIHSQLSALVYQGADTATLKTAFEQYFDIESLIDYNVFHDFICNGDGSLKNWQWFTYDGQRWMVTPYDLDQTFGINLYGVVRPAAHRHAPLTEGPFYWIDKYYQRQLRQRYIQLRQNGTLTAETILPIIQDWVSRVGETRYSQERQLWPDSPCYGDPICNEGWEVYPHWEYYDTAPAYNKAATYHVGDICKLEGRLWQTTQTITRVNPYIRNSQIDTLARLQGWVTDRIAYLDKQYSYTPSSPYDLDGDGILTIADITTLIRIYLDEE